MTKFDAYLNGTKLNRGDKVNGLIFDHVSDGNKVVTVDKAGMCPVEWEPGQLLGVQLRRAAGRIDMTPTWRGVLPYLLLGYRDGNATGQKIATEELAKMADLADRAVASASAPLDWRPVSEYVNTGDGTTTDQEPRVMLSHGKTGYVVLGKVIRFADGEVRTVAPGYLGYEWTMFATFNTPKVSE